MEKRKIFLVFALSFILFNSIFVSAVTGSIGNAKAVLYPEVNGLFNTVIDRTIKVKNVNDIPVLINLTLDEKGKEFLELQDESFVLQPGEEKDAQFKVKVRKEGNYEGRVNVFFSPEDVTSKEAGVVLSSTVVVLAKKDQGYEEKGEDVKEENQGSVTGEAVEGENNKSNSVNFLLYFSPVLLIALLVLLYVMGKKGKKPKYRKKQKQ